MTKQYALKCTIYVDVFDDEDVEDVCNTVAKDIAGFLGVPVELDDIEDVDR